MCRSRYRLRQLFLGNQGNFGTSNSLKELLRQFITPVLGSTRQWLPPNRRFVTQGLYIPSRKQDEELKIVIAIDTSSTMGPIIQDFISEVDSIMRSFGAFELTIIQADMQICNIEKFTHEEPFIPEEFQIFGGGGTDLHPPFNWVESKMLEPPKALLYMTDGYGPAPHDSPGYPVLWVLNDNGRTPCRLGYNDSNRGLDCCSTFPVS